MIEIATVIGLLGPIAKKRTEPEVLLFDPIYDAENEPGLKEANESGAKFRWASEGKLSARKRDGWKPFVDRDSFMRPRVYMDRNRELLLMVKDT